MTIRTLTIDQLCLSPMNVRTNQQDANETEALEASILAHGLLFPLVVHPMKGSKTKFGVLAGGRRYRALRRLVDNGDLPADWAIETVVRDLTDREITEVSLAENMLRRELRPYEVFAAISKANRKGASPEDIAKRFGQRIEVVRQFLRLGNLEPEVFAAYSRGDLTRDQANAYAATEDHALQRMVYDCLRNRADFEHKPNHIRGLMKIGDHSLEKQLRLVGKETYLAAGGVIEPDLFEPEELGRIVNIALLKDLTDKHLEAFRESIRARADRPVRFSIEKPRTDTGTDWGLEFHPAVSELAPDQAARLNALHIEQADFEEMARDLLDADGNPLPGKEDAIAHIDASYNPNDAEIAAIEAERRFILPAVDIFATIDIKDAGETELRWWYATRTAKRLAEKVPSAGAGAAADKPAASREEGSALDDREFGSATAAANAAAKEEHGLSQDAVQIFRAVRRGNLRALLIENANTGGTIGHDYLIWSQLRIALGKEPPHRVGARGLSMPEANPPVTRPHVETGVAWQIYQESLRDMSAQGFITEPNLAAAFIDFVNSTTVIKNRAAALLAAIALERSLNADGYRVAVHDAVALMTRRSYDAAVRAVWSPTAELLDLFPKVMRLSIASPFVEPGTFRTWRNLKSAEITPLVLKVVLGASAALRALAGRKAAEWVHPLLQFPEPDLGDRGAAAAAPAAPAVDDGQQDLEQHLQEAQ